MVTLLKVVAVFVYWWWHRRYWRLQGARLRLLPLFREGGARVRFSRISGFRPIVEFDLPGGALATMKTMQFQGLASRHRLRRIGLTVQVRGPGLERLPVLTVKQGFFGRFPLERIQDDELQEQCQTLMVPVRHVAIWSRPGRLTVRVRNVRLDPGRYEAAVVALHGFTVNWVAAARSLRGWR